MHLIFDFASFIVLLLLLFFKFTNASILSFYSRASEKTRSPCRMYSTADSRISGVRNNKRGKFRTFDSFLCIN